MNIHTDHRVLVGVAAIVFLLLSTIVAVLPAFEAEKATPIPGSMPLEEAAARGRALYLKEGCAVCHTQFVRDLPMDTPYGRGSVASDYALEDPPLLGTQRTGPDLSNVGVRQPSEIWNLIHLYNPRAVVPTSVMPGYPWYFQVKRQADEGDIVVPVPEGYRPNQGVVVANDEALELVRYLQSLQQTPLDR